MRLLPFFIIIPLGAAFFESLLGKKLRGLPDALACLATLSLAVISFLAVGAVRDQGAIIYTIGGWPPPLGIDLVLDGLSGFMLVIVNVIAFFVSIYSISYMARYTAKWKFYTLFMLMVSGMNGVIITGDFFNLYIFLEVASLASYSLVAFGIEADEIEASIKYAVMGSVASALILMGIVFLYSYTSTLNMADMARELLLKGHGGVLNFVLPLFIVGFGLKTALVPFHGWLPDAHPSAPAPISAMLSGVIVKTLGIYSLCRIFYNVMGVDQRILSLFMFLGAISMILGGLMAIGQSDLKRLMAYSSISQIGYIIFGIGLGTPLGLFGGLFHLFNHSVMKSLLFLNAGAVEYATGTRDLEKLGGLASKMPFTGLTSLIASMSISGIPPFAGFFSKLIIIVAAVQAGRLSYAFCAVIASILTLAAFMKVMNYGFYGKLNKGLSAVKDVPLFMKISMAALAVLCLAGGALLLPDISSTFIKTASDVLANGTGYFNTIMQKAAGGV